MTISCRSGNLQKFNRRYRRIAWGISSIWILYIILSFLFFFLLIITFILSLLLIVFIVKTTILGFLKFTTQWHSHPMNLLNQVLLKEALVYFVRAFNHFLEVMIFPCSFVNRIELVITATIFQIWGFLKHQLAHLVHNKALPTLEQGQ